MQEEIAQMRTLMRNQAGFETVSESPLSLVLEKARIDRTLKTPALDHFDGSSDPLAFLNTFDGRMAFFGHSEIARCQFFSTCLQGTTLRWYSNLPPRSIDSWTTLKSKFQARFSSNYKGIKVTASLMTMHQRSGESCVPDYRTPHDASRSGKLYTISTEVVKVRTSPPPRTSDLPPRDRRERDWQPHNRSEKEFTKLNTEKTTILAVLKTEPDYRPPRPMKPGRPPSSRYCEYHEDTGHTTEQCFQLSNLIEGKIRRGQLVHYVQHDDEPRRQHRGENDRVIDVIFGGVAGGLSHNSRKIYAREVFNVNPSTAKRPRVNPSLVISF
ncbi:uncharacterized protein LOC141703346 [Apium graveolens]|uniref:uncharacterized protein LOC141703344 n=1 Tax=Apium graveolens TaxID=4045 RepID=UPI003D7A6D66